jgi:FlaA1/EpsC-like NDP-sugar epimerase
MITNLHNVVRVKAKSWWRNRVPTRESIVVAALLAVIFEASYLAAFFIRGELLFRPSDDRTILSTIGYVVALKLVVFYVRGLCHRPWRAARFVDLNNLIRASTTALLLLVAFNYFGSHIVRGHVVVPRSVILLDWVFTLLGVGGMQAVARSIFEELMPSTPAGKRVALVVDASEEGRRLAKSLSSQGGEPYFVAGLLDDDPLHYGLHVDKARVLGPVSMAAACAERLRASEIVIREGAIYGARLRALCDACAAINVRVQVAERPVDAVSSAPPAEGLGYAPRVRGVELRDLLSRPQANLGNKDAHVLPFIRGKSILVTGAGGSIGSEICRQIMRFEPARLVMLERSEYSLFSIHLELVGQYGSGGARLVPVLADITNADRTDRILAEHRPDVIIHAAAFKHVPLMEAHPVEAVENNALATASLAELADTHGVEAFVALSTDKAVYPSSVMGASKLVAERFLQSFGETSRTRFVTVRFGNVLGSSGSAVPIFQEQLGRGLPIAITHPDVRRYFMTIDEAAQLVLFAGSLAGNGGTYVLEMGESLPIVEVVQRLAFVMNIPGERVRIEYSGLRPGEKLEEELFFEDEDRRGTDNPLVTRVSRPARPLNEVRSWLAELKHASGTDPQTTFQALMDIVSSDCGGLVPPGSSAPPTGSEPASADHGVASVVRDQSAPQSVNVPV